MANARPLTQAFQWLPSKHIRPSGWLAQQMQFDLNQGFVGHLDQLVPELITEDDIYGKHRRTLADKASRGVVVGDGRQLGESAWVDDFLALFASS